MNKEFLESLTQNLIEVMVKYNNDATREAIKAVIYALENAAEENSIEIKRKIKKKQYD